MCKLKIRTVAHCIYTICTTEPTHFNAVISCSDAHLSGVAGETKATSWCLDSVALKGPGIMVPVVMATSSSALALQVNKKYFRETLSIRCGQKQVSGANQINRVCQAWKNICFSMNADFMDEISFSSRRIFYLQTMVLVIYKLTKVVLRNRLIKDELIKLYFMLTKGWIMITNILITMI